MVCLTYIQKARDTGRARLPGFIGHGINPRAQMGTQITTEPMPWMRPSSGHGHDSPPVTQILDIGTRYEVLSMGTLGDRIEGLPSAGYQWRATLMPCTAIVA